MVALSHLKLNTAISIYFFLTIFWTWKSFRAEYTEAVMRPQLFSDRTVSVLIFMKKLLWTLMGLYSSWVSVSYYMNYYEGDGGIYILIGLGLSFAGVLLFKSDWDQFYKELEAEKSFMFVFWKNFFSSLFFGDRFGLFGIILILVGLAFIGSGLNLW